MKKLIYISLIALAGCSSLTAPPQGPTTPSGQDLSAYFWADSTATYTYISSVRGTHTLAIQKGGQATDQDSNFTTDLTIQRTNSTYSVSGFSSNDFLELGNDIHVVADTALPPAHSETIRSIAAVNPKSFSYGKLYAASDTILYRVDLGTLSIVRLNPLPITGLRLQENVGGIGLYAVQFGGNSIFWTSDSGAHWKSYSTPPGTAITAFASADPTDDHYDGTIFWVACGSQVFRFTTIGSGTMFQSSLSRITALEAQSDGDVIVAGDNGIIFDLNHSGLAEPIDTVPGRVGAIAQHYVSTPAGVFDYSHPGPAIITGNDSSLYSTGISIFAAEDDGTVDHFSVFGTPNPVTLPAPNSAATVTQFAFPYVGQHDVNKGIYAVSGGTIYYRQDASTWVPINQVISGPLSFKPGSLTLLSSDSTWTAGFIESTKNGLPKGYTYVAKSSSQFAHEQILVGGMMYSNVIIVNLTSMANGVADTQDIPQYNIYFEKGIGPALIERTVNGSTTSLSLPR